MLSGLTLKLSGRHTTGRLLSTLLLSVATLAGLAASARAEEGGAGFYILGSRTLLGGVVVPPGTYVQQSIYAYSGSTGGEIAYPDRLEIGVDGTAWIGLTSVLWAPSTEPVLGGRPYFSFTLPYGYKSMDLDATLTQPGGTVLSGSRSKDSTLMGDPVAGAGLGWDQGNWHSSLNLLINVPIGDYSSTRSTNVSFNRWAADVTGAVTWLNTDNGWQANLATGVTFNGENEDTSYDSGHEFHVEGALGKTLGTATTVSLQGYYYKQITGDSGSGAVLGNFEGEVTALGPAISWSGQLGGNPVTLDGRWFHEFDVTNRLKGDAVLASMTFAF